MKGTRKNGRAPCIRNKHPTNQKEAHGKSVCMTPRERLQLLSRELRERNPTLNMHYFGSCALGWGAANIPQFEAEGWGRMHSGEAGPLDDQPRYYDLPYLIENSNGFCVEDAMQFFRGGTDSDSLYYECFAEKTYRTDYDLSNLPGIAVASSIDQFLERNA